MLPQLPAKRRIEMLRRWGILVFIRSYRGISVFVSMVGFSCTLMVTWERLLTAWVYGLTNGGPAGLVYGSLFCCVGYLAVTISLAELVSMAPTAGGQYQWTFLLASTSTRRFLSLVTGWQSLISWQACLASAAYIGGTAIQGLLILKHREYGFAWWHGTLVFYGAVSLAMIANTVLARSLPKIEAAVPVLHILGFFYILISLSYLAPHSAPSEVFTKFLNTGGYDKGTCWFVGLITSVFPFLGADGAMHISEEIRNANTVVPQLSIMSIAINGLLGFSMLLILSFSIGDIKAALTSPTSWPFIEIFHQATRSVTGAIVIVATVLSLLLLATFPLLAASSRMLWAFARDNGVPFSR